MVDRLTNAVLIFSAIHSCETENDTTGNLKAVKLVQKPAGRRRSQVSSLLQSYSPGSDIPECCRTVWLGYSGMLRCRLARLFRNVAVSCGVVFSERQALCFEKPAAHASHPEARSTVDVSAHVGESVALEFKLHFMEF